MKMRYSNLQEMLKKDPEAKLKFLSGSPSAQAVMCEFADEIRSTEEIDAICEMVEQENERR